MTLQAGTKLGPYEILSPLGAGGMGEVWKAKDTRLDRFVAVKVLPEHLTRDADALARFEREAKALAMLDHPNLVALFDVGHEDATAYAVLELLEGETLRDLLARGAPPLRQALDIARQVAQGLAGAHGRGIVHRDLKPENTFLLKDGRVKLLDFGLAKKVDLPRGAEASTQLAGAPADTGAGHLLGTVGYMSPEQVRGQAADARSDIFAFGCVLFELLTGKRAFTGPTAVDALHAILNADPDLESESLPPGLRLLLGHCLDKDPARRFHDAQDIVFALESSASSARGRALPQDGPRRPALRIAGTAAAAGLLLLAAGFAAGRAGIGRPAASLHFVAKTFEPMTLFNARFAPDGRTVFLSAAQGGNEPRILEIRPDSPIPRPLGPPRTHLLSVSRHGEWLVLAEAVYIGQRLFRGTLARMQPDGAPRPVGEQVREADWGPDGKVWALIRDLGNERDRLEFPAGTPLYEIGGYLSDPRVSPDGQRVAFFEHASKYDDRGMVKSVDLRGTVVQHSGEYSALEGLAWSGDGRRLHFSAQPADRAGPMHPMAVDIRPGSRVRPTQPTPGDFILYDLSAAGTLVGSRDTYRRGIRGRLPGDLADREFSWLNESTGPILSEDLQWVLFTDEREGGNYKVALRRTNGSPVAHLGEGRATGFSPDGKWAIADVESPFRLMLYSAGAGPPRRLGTGPLNRAFWAQWIPGREEILLAGQEPSQPLKLYRLSLAEGATPVPFNLPGLVQTKARGSLAPDGTRVVGNHADGRVGVFDLRDGSFTRLAGLESDHRGFCGWSGDGRALYLRDPGSLPVAIRRLDVASGAIAPRPDIIINPPEGSLSVGNLKIQESAAGRAIVYGYYQRTSELFLLEGLK